MRHELNFARPLFAVAPWLVVVAHGLIVVSIIAMIGLLVDSVVNYRELDDLSERADTLHTRVEQLTKGTSDTDTTKLYRVRDRVQQLRGMIDVKGSSINRILTDLEHFLPKAARVISLHHRATTGEATLAVEAVTRKPLTAFLQALEDSGHYTNVLLVRESKKGVGKRARINYELLIKG